MFGFKQVDKTTDSSPSDSPNVSGGSHPGPSPTHDSLLTRAEDLSKQLRIRKRSFHIGKINGQVSAVLKKYRRA